MNEHYDVAIIGSGFSGSILARILAKHGRRVVLLDAAKHPRFAIGESSTPIADLLLRQLGERYSLPDLVSLSSYGRWQKSLPGLTCGIKRGFSYFDHRGQSDANSETYLGQRSLIVAASPTDAQSDTHWYRSDVDTFLFKKAIDAGVDGRQQTAVTALDVTDTRRPMLQLENGTNVTATYLIDASGVAAASARLLERRPLVATLRTRTCSSFAHFRGVKSFAALFNSVHCDRRASDPFDADDAAQHHLIDEGWAWMLRMNNGITSVGMTSPLHEDDKRNKKIASATESILGGRFAKYPGLSGIMRESVIVGPESGIATVARVQRFFDPVVARNCWMTPTTAVNVDPLHSTGIAHAVAGVGRIADLLLNPWNEDAVHRYRESIFAEAEHIDRLTAMAYQAMGSFSRFTTACMVYFASAIACEERIGAGDIPSLLWQADDERFVAAVRHCDALIHSDSDDELVCSDIRSLLEPWNTAGFARYSRRESIRLHGNEIM